MLYRLPPAKLLVQRNRCRPFPIVAKLGSKSQADADALVLQLLNTMPAVQLLSVCSAAS